MGEDTKDLIETQNTDENINDYEPIATSDSKDYNTMDQKTVDATIDT